MVAVAVASAIVSLAGALQARDRSAGYAARQIALVVAVGSMESTRKTSGSRRQVVLVSGDDRAAGPGRINLRFGSGAIYRVGTVAGYRVTPVRAMPIGLPDRTQVDGSAPESHGLKSLVSFRF